MSSKEGAALLLKERKGASFNARELTYLIDGGKENTEKKEYFARMVKNNPIFNKDNLFFLPREKAIVKYWEEEIEALEIIKKQKLSAEEIQTLLYYVDTDSGFGSTHRSMFVPTLENQTSPQQKELWMQKIREGKIIGTYAQTELGHGSNVRELETTATFDQQTQEFVLNSPTLTSTKWWPGGLGKLSNHCIAYARLIIDGKDHGVHGFVVPIRSLETHQPLPGITVGDIGPKFGFNTVDNGFLRFKNVRIPRENMLMKYSSVKPDGTYGHPVNAKLGYGTMMYVRVGIVAGSGDVLARACTIAIRYSAIRRQFPEQEGGLEVPVLNYQVQQLRLFSQLASAYAFHIVGFRTKQIYFRLLKEIAEGNLSGLSEVHAISSGLKSVTTSLTADGIEECRKCCGGHGFSQLSGLPHLYASYVPACTYEGDNVIMLLQTAQYLIKCAALVARGKKVEGLFVHHLNHDISPNSPLQSSSRGKKDFFLCPVVQEDLMAARARGLIQQVAQKALQSGATKNSNMAEMVRMASAHCSYIIANSFSTFVKELPEGSIKKVLRRLSDFYALRLLEKDLPDFLELGLIHPHEVGQLRSCIYDLLAQIRPDAVALVDSWNFPDFLLRSSLGRYDGDCYEHLYNSVQGRGLNQEQHNSFLIENFSRLIINPTKSRL